MPVAKYMHAESCRSMLQVHLLSARACTKVSHHFSALWRQLPSQQQSLTTEASTVPAHFFCSGLTSSLRLLCLWLKLGLHTENCRPRSNHKPEIAGLESRMPAFSCQVSDIAVASKKGFFFSASRDRPEKSLARGERVLETRLHWIPNIGGWNIRTQGLRQTRSTSIC